MLSTYNRGGECTVLQPGQIRRHAAIATAPRVLAVLLLFLLLLRRQLVLQHHFPLGRHGQFPLGLLGPHDRGGGGGGGGVGVVGGGGGIEINAETTTVRVRLRIVGVGNFNSPHWATRLHCQKM